MRADPEFHISRTIIVDASCLPGQTLEAFAECAFPDGVYGFTDEDAGRILLTYIGDRAEHRQGAEAFPEFWGLIAKLETSAGFNRLTDMIMLTN